MSFVPRSPTVTRQSRAGTFTPLRPGTPVQVRCHAGCPWLDRFVVADVIRRNGDHAYLVRRLGIDGAPTVLVPARDVRADG